MLTLSKIYAVDTGTAPKKLDNCQCKFTLL